MKDIWVPTFVNLFLFSFPFLFLNTLLTCHWSYQMQRKLSLYPSPCNSYFFSYSGIPLQFMLKLDEQKMQIHIMTAGKEINILIIIFNRLIHSSCMPSLLITRHNGLCEHPSSEVAYLPGIVWNRGKSEITCRRTLPHPGSPVLPWAEHYEIFQEMPPLPGMPNQLSVITSYYDVGSFWVTVALRQKRKLHRT